MHPHSIKILKIAGLLSSHSATPCGKHTKCAISLLVVVWEGGVAEVGHLWGGGGDWKWLWMLEPFFVFKGATYNVRMCVYIYIISTHACMHACNHACIYIYIYMTKFERIGAKNKEKNTRNGKKQGTKRQKKQGKKGGKKKQGKQKNKEWKDRVGPARKIGKNNPKIGFSPNFLCLGNFFPIFRADLFPDLFSFLFWAEGPNLIF